MGDWIEHNGRSIAHYNVRVERKSREDSTQITRYNFRFNSLDDLTNLLRADDRDVIDVGGSGITIANFKREMLSKAHRIYINPDCELFDQMEG